MLVLTRKPGQLIRIGPGPALDPATPVGELFIPGPIEVMVQRVSGMQVRLGIFAPQRLIILRDELCGQRG
jgi:sRNA-binding carbon storage regulator CsrA